MLAHKHAHLRACTHKQTRMQAYVYPYTDAHTHARTQMYTCRYECRHSRACKHTHIHTHARTHARTHTMYRHAGKHTHNAVTASDLEHMVGVQQAAPEGRMILHTWTHTHTDAPKANRRGMHAHTREPKNACTWLPCTHTPSCEHAHTNMQMHACVRAHARTHTQTFAAVFNTYQSCGLHAVL